MTPVRQIAVIRSIKKLQTSRQEAGCGTRRSRDRGVTRPHQELWVRPETAAIRIAPSTKPTMPITEKIKLCQPVKRLRLGSLKKSVNSLLISITGKSRERLAPKHQTGPCCFAAGTNFQRSAAPAREMPITQ